MQKVKMTIAYDGTDFAGYQRQPGRRTVQSTLEEALGRITASPVSVTGAGRTDAGVHARGQVVHFETEAGVPLERWTRVLNHVLPQDLAVLSVEAVPKTFHARYDACWKRYRYTLDTRPVPDVFTRRYRTHLTLGLDVERMRQAAGYLVGTHDFSAFSSARTTVKDKVRTLYQCEVEVLADGVIAIVTAGNGFLYHMVRIISGTLVEAGMGKLDPAAVSDILQGRDRSRAGKTLPAQGLTMVEVHYEPWPE
ncbi:tRNA pseudouridine(38-40) synthase TruA [Salinithrix halophila]|uniref:tRNA pseudouridine synthase A n=1 Tax=Salinithrix halophila TaxID=1485204 RepID=A0ABV8JA64_9BACL